MRDSGRVAATSELCLEDADPTCMESNLLRLVLSAAPCFAGGLGRARGGDRCGSRLGPAMPSGVVGSSTRPAISQVSGGRLGLGERAAAADAGGRLVSRTGGYTSSRWANVAAQEAVAVGSPAFEEVAILVDGFDLDPPTGKGTKGWPARGVPVDHGQAADMEFSMGLAAIGGLGTLLVECGALAEDEVQAFMDFWCEADIAKFMSPERAAVALEVQRVLCEGQDRCGGAVGEVLTSGGLAGSCSRGQVERSVRS